MKKNRRKRKEKELEKELLRLQQIVNSFSRRKRKYRIEKASHGNTLVFAVIGDTHIGSLYERTDALQEFYKLLASEKINVVLHCGDLTDGNKVYRGQEFEQYAIGFGQQKEAVLERFPKISGIETFIIGGNHDMSYFKRNGILAVQEICKERDDLHYLDDEIATIILETKNGKRVKYLLMHPSGATAYSVSYKSQKIVEAISGGKKPKAIFIGHFHKADYMPQWRNVHCFQVGCFESQTPYMSRKPTPAHIGGWIIEHTIEGKLTDRLKAEFINFYEK